MGDKTMANWVENEARRQIIMMRHGPELWRNLRVAVETAINSWKRIYCHAQAQELEYTRCLEITENCFRVRSIPGPQEKERYFEVLYDPNTGFISVRPERHRQAFHMCVTDDGKVTLIKPSTDERPETPVSVEDVSRCLLKPFLDEFGLRKPLVTLEEI
jgi:hypothetical protein